MNYLKEGFHRVARIQYIDTIFFKVFGLSKTHCLWTGKMSKIPLFIKRRPLVGFILFLKNLFISPYKNSLQKPNVLYFPFLTPQPWSDSSDPWKTLLEQNVGTIRNEFLINQVEAICIPASDLQPVNRGSWKIIRLLWEGKKTRESESFPKTMEIIEKIPHCASAMGHVFFSILLPGARIKPHYGPVNTRICYHLGIKIPKNVWITVANKKHEWIQDKCISFDDSFIHEVVHNGTEPRIILNVDLWHPELSTEERTILSFLHRGKL